MSQGRVCAKTRQGIFWDRNNGVWELTQQQEDPQLPSHPAAKHGPAACQGTQCTAVADQLSEPEQASADSAASKGQMCQTASKTYAEGNTHGLAAAGSPAALPALQRMSWGTTVSGGGCHPLTGQPLKANSSGLQLKQQHKGSQALLSQAALIHGQACDCTLPPQAMQCLSCHSCQCWGC